MSRTYYAADPKQYGYDYTNQAWVKDGVYQDCNHPADMNCCCFGRAHKGEAVRDNVELQ